MVGNPSQGVRYKGSLTASYNSSRDEKESRLSDPVVPHGRAIAQRIKATLGITGLSPPEFTSTGRVWHVIDVGSSHPGAVVRSQGLGLFAH